VSVEAVGARLDYVTAGVAHAGRTGNGYASRTPGNPVNDVARRLAFWVIGLAAGFSGLAVIATIITGLPLRIFELGLIAIAGTALVLVLRRTPPHIVREVMPVVRAGIIAGAIATVAYDASRTVLATFDPSPFNPFAAIRQFGLGIVPEGSPDVAIMAAGMLVHLVNGCSVGVIYAAFVGRQRLSTRAAVATGVLWGLSLELVQSILYPGWLGITTVLGEFLLISSAGHLVYGLTLGLLTRRMLASSAQRENLT
jgi:hypothetical protein